MAKQLTILLTAGRVHIAPGDGGDAERRPLERHTFDVEVPRTLNTGTELSALTKRMIEGVREIEQDLVSCRLVIPAGWSFTGVVELPDKFSESSARFAFEEYVPFALEQLTCAVQPLPDGSALVVAVCTEPLRSFLNQLESERILVHSVHVDSMLSLDCDEKEGGRQASGEALLDLGRLSLHIPHSEGADGANGRTMLLGEARRDSAILTNICTLMATSCVPIMNWRILTLSSEADSNEVSDMLQSAGATTTMYSSDGSIDLLMEAAAAAPESLNLRRGALRFAGRWDKVLQQATRCAVCIAVLIASITLTGFVTAHRLSRGVEGMRPIKSELYQQVFPKTTMPPGAALRVRSERIKLQALTRQGGVSVAPFNKAPMDPLAGLHDIAAVIPKDLRLFVTELVVDEDGATMAGRTIAHSAVGDLVQALNTISGMQFDPPRTKLRPDKTVDFTIKGRRVFHERDAQPNQPTRP